MMIRADELKVPDDIPATFMFPVKCNSCGLIYWVDGKMLAEV